MTEESKPAKWNTRRWLICTLILAYLAFLVWLFQANNNGEVELQLLYHDGLPAESKTEMPVIRLSSEGHELTLNLLNRSRTSIMLWDPNKFHGQSSMNLEIKSVENDRDAGMAFFWPRRGDSPKTVWIAPGDGISYTYNLAGEVHLPHPEQAPTSPQGGKVKTRTIESKLAR